MQDEQTRWDDKLSTLEASVRSGDHVSALEQFLAFDETLDLCLELRIANGKTCLNVVAVIFANRLSSDEWLHSVPS